MHKSCVFCTRRGLKVLYEDAKLYAIADAKPRAKHHLLVVSQEHIPSARDLRGPGHAELVRSMVRAGGRLLDALEGPSAAMGERVFGFHLPPFNSVAHLHLHCLAPPFTPWWQHVRYTPFLGTFETAEALLRRLDRPI